MKPISTNAQRLGSGVIHQVPSRFGHPLFRSRPMAKFTRCIGVLIASNLSFLALQVLSQNSGPSLEELLKKGDPAQVSQNGDAKVHWKNLVAAFAQNDEKTGIAEAKKLEVMRGLLTPQQVEAMNLLVQLSNITGETPADASIDMLKKQGQESLAELNNSDNQLTKIEAKAATLPKTFSSGSQVHGQWIQLQREKDHWTARKQEAQVKYDGLKKKFEERRSELFGVIEGQIVLLLDGLADMGEIDAAVALANTYLRRNKAGSSVSAKGEALIALQRKEAFVRELVAAVEKDVNPLANSKRLSAAHEKLVQSERLVTSRITDEQQKIMFDRLMMPARENLAALQAEGDKLLKIARSAVKADPVDGQERLALLAEVWADCPDLKSLRADIDMTNRDAASVANEKRLATIEQMSGTDPDGARELLDSFEKQLGPDDALIAKVRIDSLKKQLVAADYQERLSEIDKIASSDPTVARDLLNALERNLNPTDALISSAKIQALKTRVWEAELTAIRADVDEAHRFLAKDNIELSILLQKGDESAFRGKLKATAYTDNLIRAKSLLESVVVRAGNAVQELNDPILKSRAQGLLDAGRTGAKLLTQESNLFKAIMSSKTTTLAALLGGGIVMLAFGAYGVKTLGRRRTEIS